MAKGDFQVAKVISHKMFSPRKQWIFDGLNLVLGLNMYLYDQLHSEIIFSIHFPKDVYFGRYIRNLS